MSRFCASVDWEAARPRGLYWPSILRALGDGASDGSPAGNPRLRIGVWSPERRPPTTRALVTEGPVTVLFSGYLRQPVPPPEGEARAVLGRYRAGDWGWLRNANGVFALGVIDRDEERCVLAVDRLGVRPLYFRADESGLAFGEDLAAVAATTPGPADLDHDTLQELMALGFPLNSGRTFVREIERVPPGTWIELGPGRRRATRYWSLEDVPPIRRHDTDAFLDESQARLRGVLRELLARSARHAVCLLSSGLDSRRLLLEGHAVGARLTAVTAVWPYQGQAGTTIEPAVTTELCRALGFPHRLVGLPGSPGAMEPREARALRDVLLDYQVYGRHHIWAVPLVAALEPADETWNLDGMAGDTLFNNPFYSLPKALWGRWRVDAGTIETIVPGANAWDRMWNGLQSRSLAARVRDTLAGLPEDPRRFSFFYLLGRTRAMVALLPYGLLNLRVESFCPYLDNEVMEHALTMDPIATGERRLQALALRRHFPALAHIPSSHSQPADVPPSYRQNLPLAGPDFIGAFDAGDLLRLLRAKLFPSRRPQIDGRDLVFTASRALGLRWPAGWWRASRVRDLVHTATIMEQYGRIDPRALVQARTRARLALERAGASIEWQRSHVH